jgi:hypothetical protein
LRIQRAGLKHEWTDEWVRAMDASVNAVGKSGGAPQETADLRFEWLTCQAQRADILSLDAQKQGNREKALVHVTIAVAKSADATDSADARLPGNLQALLEKLKADGAQWRDPRAMERWQKAKLRAHLERTAPARMLLAKHITLLVLDGQGGDALRAAGREALNLTHPAIVEDTVEPAVSKEWRDAHRDLSSAFLKKPAVD